MMQKTDNFLLIQAEAIVSILAGIISLVFDYSFITFGRDLEKIWKIALDPYKFPPLSQLKLKYFLCALLIVRTFTVHVSIALYVVMLWPAIFAEREYLLIPWIFVGTIRLLVNFMSTFAGLYISLKYGIINTLWIEFLLVQILQHGPFFYVWLTVVKYRVTLKKIAEAARELLEQEVYKITLCKQSRHILMEKRKSILENQKDLISQSTITTIVDRLSTRHKENMSTRSLDTLLELIEKGHRKDDINSVNSDISSDQTDTNFQSLLMQRLQITEKDVVEAKRNKLNNFKRTDYSFGQHSRSENGATFDSAFEKNSAKMDDSSLTYDLGSNEIEQDNITMSYKSEIEDGT